MRSVGWIACIANEAEITRQPQGACNVAVEDSQSDEHALSHRNLLLGQARSTFRFMQSELVSVVKK